MQAYHDGELSAIDAVEVETGDGAFFEQAWKVLRTVPAGAPVSYRVRGGMRQPVGGPRRRRGLRPQPVALFVPCHRVLRSDGSLGGFRWGLPVKQWLLDHESEGCGRSAPGPRTRASS